MSSCTAVSSQNTEQFCETHKLSN